jgi:catechol 2,3-dioxygenase-like lactoylglutathione lyase family enzyme
MKALLEVVILPVSDADRSLRFYRDQSGFELDVDYAPSPDFRVVQLTPHGSNSSIQFGVGLTDAPPGSVRGLYLVVRDIEAYQRELRDWGLGVSEIRHKDTDGGWRGGYLPRLDPGRSDYASFADLRDPDGNAWVLQERGYRPT